MKENDFYLSVEISAKSHADSWLREAFWKMTLPQLDRFFYYAWSALFCSNFARKHRTDVVFRPNRIDRELRFSYSLKDADYDYAIVDECKWVCDLAKRMSGVVGGPCEQWMPV